MSVQVLTPHQLLSSAIEDINKLGKNLSCKIGTKNNKAWFMSVSTKVDDVEKVLFIHNTTRALGFCNNGGGVIMYIMQHVNKWIEREYADMDAVNLHDGIIDHIVNHFIKKSNYVLPQKNKKMLSQKVKVLFNKAFEDPANPHMITDHVFRGLMKYLEPGIAKTSTYISKSGHTNTNQYLVKVNEKGEELTKYLDWKIMQALSINNIKCIPLGLPAEDPENKELVKALTFIDTIAEGYEMDKLSAMYLTMFLFNYGSPEYNIEQEKIRIRNIEERKLMKTPASVDSLINLQDAFGHVSF